METYEKLVLDVVLFECNDINTQTVSGETTMPELPGEQQP